MENHPDKNQKNFHQEQHKIKQIKLIKL
jgi:hypothetical protein